jgi:hypothetical protein
MTGWPVIKSAAVVPALTIRQHLFGMIAGRRGFVLALEVNRIYDL